MSTNKRSRPCILATCCVPWREDFTVNADASKSAVRVELLDDNENAVRGYSGKDAAIMHQSGFQTPVEWRGTSEVRDLPERIRIHVTFEGKRNTDIRFSALYLI